MNVVIVTHGRLAEGFANAAEVLLGTSAAVIPICVGETGERGVAERVTEALEACDGPTVIVTDVLAGSTTQAAFPIARERGVPFVTGANLSLVMELVLADAFDLTMVDAARDQVMLLET
ncbi:MAG: hypothetical protein IJI88_01230 [Atopobiaceae bacterium]|nr:hypothetical protein [Olsenella sp.]MBQ6490877.1 hypothetical protein [Atopobiaceae bacterium]